MSKCHSKKRSGSYCEGNVITKYFRSSESLEQSIGSDDICTMEMRGMMSY